MIEEEHHVRVAPGVRLRVLAWRPERGARAPAFLLVHGLASNGRLWAGVASALAEAGHHAVAVDQRGHGGSDRDPDGRYDLAALTDDLVAVMAALRLDRPVAVGQSWGGTVAVELGRRHPDAVTGVVGVDGGVIDLQAGFADWDACREALAPPPLAGTPLDELVAGLRRRHPDWSELAIAGQRANLTLRPDGTVEPHLSRDDHLTILRGLWEHRPRSSLAALTVPVLLLPVTPPDPDAATLARKRAAVAVAEEVVADLHVRWFDGHDHDVHAQAPEAVAAELLAAARAWDRAGEGAA